MSLVISSFNEFNDIFCCERRGGIMVSALIFESSGPGSSPCVLGQDT